MRFSATAALTIIATALLLPAPAFSCAAGAKCLTPKVNLSKPPFAAGDTLPRGEYQMLMNSGYYGLPALRDGTLYFRVDRYVMRVDPTTMEILEDVTRKMNRAF